MDHILYPAIFVLAFVIVYIRLLVPYIGFFARFMFNETVGWDKNIEKPRLVFYGVGLLLMHFSAKAIFHDLPRSISIMVVLNWGIFLSGFYFCLASWSKRFKSVFIPRIKKQIRPSKNFNIAITENQLERLYEEMIGYDMVIKEKTKVDDFVNCFLLDWDDHDSKIYFRLDNPSCREFYELFKTSFPNNSLQLIDFISNSNIIRRVDGKKYNYDTVRNAGSRSPISKRTDDLNAIFSIFS